MTTALVADKIGEGTPEEWEARGAFWASRVLFWAIGDGAGRDRASLENAMEGMRSCRSQAAWLRDHPFPASQGRYTGGTYESRLAGNMAYGKA